MNNEDLVNNEEFKKASKISYYEKDLNKYVDLPCSAEEAITNPKEYRRKIKETYKNKAVVILRKQLGRITKLYEELEKRLKKIKNAVKKIFRNINIKECK